MVTICITASYEMIKILKVNKIILLNIHICKLYNI